MRILKCFLAILTLVSYQFVWAGQLLGARKFDELGNIKTELTNDLNAKSYEYQKNDILFGRISSYLDPNNNRVSFQYDEKTGAVIQDTVSNQQGTSLDSNYYTYDEGNYNLIAVENSYYKVNYDYYPHEGPLKSVEYQNKNYSDLKGYKVELLYDQNGILQGAQDSLNFQEGLEYDEKGRLSKYSFSNGKEISNSLFYAYDPFNRVSEIQIPNKNNAYYEYNGEGRISSFILGSSKNDYLMKYIYEYSAAGNLLELRLFAKDKKNLNQEHNILVSYDYDNLNHLIDYRVSNVDLSFQDPYLFPRGMDGNIITQQKYFYTINSSLARVDTFALDIYGTSSLLDKATFSFDLEHNNPDRVMNVYHTNPAMMSNAGFGSNVYDNNGNLIQDQKGSQYSYNARNEMVELKTALSQTNYNYYPTGKIAQEQSQVSKSDHAANPLNGVPVQYYYNSNGKTLLQTQGNSYKRIFNDNVSIVKNSEGEEKTVYQHKDLQGSVVAVFENENPSLTEQYVYTPYGTQTNVFKPEETFPYYNQAYDISNNNVGFTGQSYNSASGIMMMGGYRGYDPLVGSFTKQDSYSVFNGVANRYAYANGNPIFYVDPSGHFSMPAWFGGALTIAISVGMTALGIGLAVVSAGTMTPLAILGLGLMMGSGVMSAATGALNIAQQYTSGQTKEALYWASIGTGIASFALSAAAGGVQMLSAATAPAGAATAAGASAAGAAATPAAASAGGAAAAAAKAGISAAAAGTGAARNFAIVSFVVGKAAEATNRALTIALSKTEEGKTKNALYWAAFGATILSSLTNVGINIANALNSATPMGEALGILKASVQGVASAFQAVGVTLKEVGQTDLGEYFIDLQEKVGYGLTALLEVGQFLNETGADTKPVLSPKEVKSQGNGLAMVVFSLYTATQMRRDGKNMQTILRSVLNKFAMNTMVAFSAHQQTWLQESVFDQTF